MSRLKLFAVLAFACVGLLAQTTASADDRKMPREAGSRVFGYWMEDGFWYPATVISDTERGIEVRYDDDGSERLLPPGQVVNLTLEVGSAVEGNWLGNGGYYEGEIGSIDGDVITINYLDGDVERTTVDKIRLEAFYVEGYVIGQLVFARWDADGHWYPGQITGLNDGTFDIKFDEGGASTVNMQGLSYHSVAEGTRVEGNWLGGGLYYPGTITHRRGNLIHIVYDDGDEEDTTIAFIRLDSAPAP
jgi:hypothetical protein